MSDNKDGPVWLITGAAGALGRELVKSTLLAGNDCIALDRNARGLDRLHDELVESGLPAPALMPLDLAGAGPADYDKLAETIEAKFDHIDLLIHNAASFTALRPLLHQPPDEWMATIQAGLTGPLLLTSALMPLFADRGRVVFVNDAYCLEKPANWAAYGVAQAGRRQMVRMLRAEAGRRGPSVVEIDPGPFFSTLRTAAWPSDTPDDLPSAADAAKSVMAAASAD